MNLRFFFEGMKDRELTASAFLAMVLEGSAEFRLAFLRSVLGEHAVDPGQWAVVVEADNVDITMFTPWLTVLIENKVRAGTVTAGQLVGYYLQTRMELSPEHRIAAVYLAPRGVGRSEVQAASAAVVGTDVVAHLSWEDDVARFASAITDARERELVSSGLEAVLQDIDDHRHGLASTDERVAVRQIGAAAHEALQRACPDVPLYHWAGQNYECVHTRAGLPFMFYLTLQFPDSGPPDFAPVTDLAEGHRTFVLESWFKQGSRVKAQSVMGQRWAALPNTIEVPGIGPHARVDARDRFTRSEPIRGTTEQVVEQVVATGAAIVGSIGDLLGEEAMTAVISAEPADLGS